jgi:hypothetical protein
MDPEKVIVQVLRRKKNAVLVEYVRNGEPIRVSISATKLTALTQDNKAEILIRDLSMGIPYGIPWSSRLSKLHFEITGEAIEQEFHKSGIWTLDDFRKNPQALTGVIMSVSREVVTQIVQTVKEYSTKEV